MTTQTFSPESTAGSPATAPADSSPAPPRALRRAHRRLLGGVCGGLAAYTGVDVAVLRVLLVVSTLFAGAGVAVYAAAWLLVPVEGSDRSPADRLLGR
jgi:phage shock protein PspC (stress-responsive transcriptional regulator)